MAGDKNGPEKTGEAKHQSNLKTESKLKNHKEQIGNTGST